MKILENSIINTPYYIDISRSNEDLMKFLAVRVIVDSRDIYPLLTNKPVVIPVASNHPSIIATDGFHYTKPLELIYREPSYYRFRVTCAIDDLQLLGGSFLLILFYLLGFLTGFFLLKILSFVPLLWFLVVYYINRKQFIRIVPSR